MTNGSPAGSQDSLRCCRDCDMSSHEILTAYILGIMVHQATDIVTAYVIGIVICQAMKIAGTHVGKIAIYEETAGREHYGDEKKNPCWSM